MRYRRDVESYRAGGPALFRLVRFWTRRWASGPDGDQNGQRVLVLEALAAAHEPTIGAVAYQLGLDRSVASRMLSDAVAAGDVSRRADRLDSRRSVLDLTAAGRVRLDGARARQGDTFAELTAAWLPEDRDRFAGYLARLANEVGA